MGELLVGTSGYSYDDWVGRVYPAGTRRAQFLELYARRFSFTELNYSYYRMPTADALRGIAQKTSSRFRFTIKAYKSLTHERTTGWQRDADHFCEAVAALRAVPRIEGSAASRHYDQLAGVLLQFPFSFHYNTANRRYLASVTDALKPLRTFVEFRNADWDQSSVWSEMERRTLGLVIPDLPRLDGLPQTPPRLTAPWGYVRFHGRNQANWWSGTNVTRYDYRYPAAELNEWIDPLHKLHQESETLIIAFNNHFEGQAVANAQELIEMLGVA